DPRVRGGRAAPHRRPHARAARDGGAPPRPRGGPVLHRAPHDPHRLGGPPAPGLTPPRPAPPGAENEVGAVIRGITAPTSFSAASRVVLGGGQTTSPRCSAG